MSRPPVARSDTRCRLATSLEAEKAQLTDMLAYGRSLTPRREASYHPSRARATATEPALATACGTTPKPHGTSVTHHTQAVSSVA